MSKEITFSKLTFQSASALISEGRFDGYITFDSGHKFLLNLADDFKDTKADFSNFVNNRGRIAKAGHLILHSYVASTHDIRVIKHFNAANTNYMQALVVSAQRLNLS